MVSGFGGFVQRHTGTLDAENNYFRATQLCVSKIWSAEEAPSQKSWVEMIENDGKLQKMTLMKSWSTEKATSQKSWIDMVGNDRV